MHVFMFSAGLEEACSSNHSMPVLQQAMLILDPNNKAAIHYSQASFSAIVFPGDQNVASEVLQLYGYPYFIVCLVKNLETEPVLQKKKSDGC